MSIRYQSKYCTIIDHCQYIANLYQKVSLGHTEFPDKLLSFKLLPHIFCIKGTKKKLRNRKRKSDHDSVLKETEMIQKMYTSFIKEALESNFNINFIKYNLLNISEVRDLASKLSEATVFDLDNINGGNDAEVALKCKVKDNYFLIPPKSRFYCGCVNKQCSKLAGKTYNILIADPPWWNKYIRRLKGAAEKLRYQYEYHSYSMMYNEEIAAIPVKDLLSSNSLVAVWCTNAPSNIRAVKELIFPKWGVEYLTTWFWLKLTIDLDPLCDFGSGCQKQPYERLIIGKVGEVLEVPHNLLFASVPSALHSHKPPLLDLLTPYVNSENPQILELFARYLLPNTTSVGFEPLKLQHISLYELT